MSSALPHVAGVSHQHIDVGGLAVHVAEAGRGRPLVLLHGWPQHWYCWRRMVPLLDREFRLIMPDLRGHGWSDAPRDGYDKEQLATDLIACLDELGLSQVGLIGHDWGGWTGFLACLRAPERFSGFVALGIPHPFQRPTVARAVQAWRMAYQVLLAAPLVSRAMIQGSSRFVAEAIRLAVSQQDAISPADRLRYGDVLRDPDRARATVQLYRTFLLREVPHLGRYLDQCLTVPTRLLAGEHDPVCTPAVLDGWQDNARDMTVERVAAAGHFLPEEAPSEVAAAIRALFT
jgi:pimeloyl-ACP methyl ester carboxylesterase